MTLNARQAFFSEKTNHSGWSGACGRMTLNARCALFSEQKEEVIFDGADHVDG